MKTHRTKPATQAPEDEAGKNASVAAETLARLIVNVMKPLPSMSAVLATVIYMVGAIFSACLLVYWVYYLTTSFAAAILTQADYKEIIGVLLSTTEVLLLVPVPCITAYVIGKTVMSFGDPDSDEAQTEMPNLINELEIAKKLLLTIAATVIATHLLGLLLEVGGADAHGEGLSLTPFLAGGLLICVIALLLLILDRNRYRKTD